MKNQPIHVLFYLKKNLPAFIMKTFLLLCCISAFSFSSNEVLSQNVKIKIDRDKSMSVDEVFNLIMSQTNYTFIYQVGTFKNSPSIKVKKGIIPANKLVEEILSTGDFKFSISNGNTILIKHESEVQEINVSGKVADISGLEMPGVMVSIKGSTKGTLTDFDGNYKLKVTSSDDVLVFSYLGYEPQEIQVNTKSKINIILKVSTNSLDEVNIVSTGYQNISKERATGSFQNIDEKVLDEKISQDILSKIEGEIAGVVFDATDGPVIRGRSTINANNDPLIVVDGFPLTQGISSINPNDVAKITVLKDAAAASIWGIRAANGVIVIVTKKGRKNAQPAITFSSNFSVTPAYSLNDFKFASTASYLDFEKYKADNKWATLPSKNNQPPLGKAVETYLKLNNGLISQAEADGIINGLRTIDNRDEFSDLFMGNSIWRQQNMSVAGGGENNTYRISLTYNANENQNYFKGNDRDQIISNISNIIQISKKLSFNTGLNFDTSTTKNNGLSQRDYLQIDQYQQILDANGNYVAQPQTIAQSYKDTKAAEGYPYNWDYNLKQEFDERDRKNNQTFIRLQTGLKYDITNYFSLEGNYQYEWGQLNTVNKYNENTYNVRDLVNTYTVFDAEKGGLVSSIPKGEIIYKQFGQNQAHTGRIQANFDKSFNDGLHNINAIGGYEVRQVRTNSNVMQKYGYDPQSLTFANIAYGQKLKVLPSGTRLFNDPAQFQEREDRFISYYGNAAYTYAKKYTVSGSIRLDDANLFGGSPEYRNIPMYSVGLLWDVKKETFLNNVDGLDILALRGTYGSNGNVDNSTSPYLQSTVIRDYLTNNLYAYISDVKNPSLRLEKTYVTNLGVDFGFFDKRLTGSIEYYFKKSVDLLAPVTISSTLGFNSALINAGQMQNKGFDIQLNGAIVKTKNFQYVSKLNFSFNKNEVTVVDVPSQTINTYLNGEPLEGKPLRYLYSYNYAGLDAKGDPLAYNENGVLIDVDGNKADGTNLPLSDVNALQYNGVTTPKYYGGWINTFNYKSFNLRVLTTFKMGHVFRNSDILDYRDMTSVYGNRHINADYENRWQNPGDENFTDVPRIPTGFNDPTKIGYQYYKNGSQFVDSASNIRLKEIILGYDIDSRALKNTGLTQLGISFQASNIAVFNYNKWNIDPESLFYPVSPTYTFNISATF